MREMKKIEIHLSTGKTLNFVGVHLKELEKQNWHYYKTEKGELIHFRKDHMIYVKEMDL